MALVIISRRSLSSSKTRTLSTGFFAGLVVLALLVTLGLGVFIGGKVRGVADLHELASALAAAQEAQKIPDPSPVLIDRIGELSARMVQLELEASGLAERLDVVKEFAQRMQKDRVPLGPVAKTPPASGGPFIEPFNSRAESTDEDAQKTPDAILNEVEQHVERISLLLMGLDKGATDVSLAHMAFPGRLPVLKGVRTSGFGNRKDPFNKKPAFHSGVDFSAPVGTSVQASAGGEVIFSGKIGGYGNVVEIDHGAGLVTRYAHLSKLLVKKNQIVMPGELIAKIGNTGRSTGPHLHFEILKDGRFVDPAIYLKRF